MSLKGRWEGKLVDVSGVSGVMELHVNDRRGQLSGDFAVYFVSEGDGCHPNSRKLVQNGEFRGKYSARSKTIKISYKLSMGLEPIAVTLTGKLRDAGNHARRAIVGCFDIEGGSRLTLGGGALVMWQYAGAEK